jgi:hypothetical protein
MILHIAAHQRFRDAGATFGASAAVGFLNDRAKPDFKNRWDRLWFERILNMVDGMRSTGASEALGAKE